MNSSRYMSPSAWRSISSRRDRRAARRRARSSWSRVRTPVVAPEPLAPPVGFTTQGVGGALEELDRAVQLRGVPLLVLGQRQAGAREDLVHGRLVERQPQRDRVVERHPVAPHPRPPRAGAQLEELAVEHVSSAPTSSAACCQITR